VDLTLFIVGFCLWRLKTVPGCKAISRYYKAISNILRGEACLQKLWLVDENFFADLGI